MRHSLPKPVLFVDIDGVLSLFGEGLDASPDAGRWVSVDGILHFLSHSAAEHLHGLTNDFELVWCSGWEDRANDHLPHAIGHGPYEFLRFGPPAGRPHWKLDAIEAHAGPRALAWIDDDLNDACHEWARARGAPTLLVVTEPATGLTAGLAAELKAWASSLS